MPIVQPESEVPQPLGPGPGPGPDPGYIKSNDETCSDKLAKKAHVTF